MPKIQAITDKMHEKSGKIAQGITDIYGSQNSVTQTIQNLGRGFSGPLPTAMTERMLLMRSQYETMNKTLTGYQVFLENAANTYEWNDQEMARWAAALGGSIPVTPSPPSGQRGTDSNSPSGNTGASGTSSTTGNTRTYNAADYQGYKGAHGKNCYSFVNQVLKDEGRGSLDGCWANGAAYLNGRDPINGGQYIISNGNNPTGDDIRAMFTNAQPGDVVQMRWRWSRTSPHTAIFAGYDENGNIKFLEANVDMTGNKQPDVSVHTYTPDKLAQLYSNVGDGGGASIYRFGDSA